MIRTTPTHKYVFTVRTHQSVVPGTLAFSLPQVHHTRRTHTLQQHTHATRSLHMHDACTTHTPAAHAGCTDYTHTRMPHAHCVHTLFKRTFIFSMNFLQIFSSFCFFPSPVILFAFFFFIIMQIKMFSRNLQFLYPDHYLDF